jgi:transposase
MENNMLKCIGNGKTVIMDNARFHRKKQLQNICEKAGAELLFLPPYSPDFNPIEKEWADMKRELGDTASLHALFETAIYKYRS